MSSIKMPKFKERKAAQVTRLFIRCNGGQSFSTRKLLKLVYLVDRKALELWGFPVTYDTPKNLPYEGLRLGHTYDLIDPPKKKSNALSMFMSDSYWYHYFCKSNEGHYTIPTELNPGTADLSRAEIELVGNVFDQFGYKTDEQLDDYCRTLPESGHSETPHGDIDWKVLLQAVGRADKDLAEIKKDLEFQAKFEGLITAGEIGNGLLRSLPLPRGCKIFLSSIFAG